MVINTHTHRNGQPKCPHLPATWERDARVKVVVPSFYSGQSRNERSAEPIRPILMKTTPRRQQNAFIVHVPCMSLQYADSHCRMLTTIQVDRPLDLKVFFSLQEIQVHSHSDHSVSTNEKRSVRTLRVHELHSGES